MIQSSPKSRRPSKAARLIFDAKCKSLIAQSFNQLSFFA
jgi:hypothetical protein